ncbi:hypothetical protein EV359DRAFT_67736 [Lentinula novae-zelandiae]|nr:hypothetical protein EV359DRAFT_67736 [Lentinula novae-zelandiae]
MWDIGQLHPHHISLVPALTLLEMEDANGINYILPELSWAEDSQIQTYTYVEHIEIIVLDNDLDSVTSGIESTTHKFHHLANGDSQDSRTYRYDPKRYGSESYDLLDKAYTADSPVLKIENPIVNSAQDKQAYNTTALLAINVELKRRLKDSEDELASIKAHVDELENKLHLWKEIFNRMGVISTSVADGSFKADKVLDSLN